MGSNKKEVEELVIKMEVDRELALQGQPWIEGWLAREMNPDEATLEWLRNLPERIRDTVVQFPPSCLVKTVECVNLKCPAPGTVGIVMSYFEAGTLGVVQSPKGIVRAQCMPTDLEAVAYRPPCDPDWMKKVLDGEA